MIVMFFVKPRPINHSTFCVTEINPGDESRHPWSYISTVVKYITERAIIAASDIVRVLSRIRHVTFYYKIYIVTLSAQQQQQQRTWLLTCCSVAQTPGRGRGTCPSIFETRMMVPLPSNKQG